jgi:hypothetical protein
MIDEGVETRRLLGLLSTPYQPAKRSGGKGVAIV